MKILCLHGYTQNASLFSRKTAALRKHLARFGHELTFVNAPLLVDPSELSYTVDDARNMRSWWVFDKNSSARFELDMAFQTVQEAIDRDGPFDGLLGFSQGAGLVGVLCSYWPALQHNHPLRCAILVAGFKLAYPGAEVYYEDAIDVPTLHVIGSADEVVDEDRSMELFRSCNRLKRWKVQHPGGHVVPGRRDVLEQIAAFLENEAAPAVESGGEEYDDDEFSGLGGL